MSQPIPTRAHGALADDSPEGLSISAFARATGVPAETLRSWERRYGQPDPIRLASGHRRYRTEDIERIRLVTALIASGRRPSEVLSSTLEELSCAAPSPTPLDPTAARWLGIAAEFGATRLREEQLAARSEMDPVLFLTERVGPFLHAVGEAWESGEWNVAQEHCASEVVHQVLHEMIADIRANRAVDSPARVLIAGLPGEGHRLASLMLEIVSRESGAETTNLGTDCPTASIAQASIETGATHILIHISAANAGIQADHALRRLDAALRSHDGITPAELIVGGAGALQSRRGVRGVTYLDDLSELGQRLKAWSNAPTSSRPGKR